MRTILFLFVLSIFWAGNVQAQKFKPKSARATSSKPVQEAKGLEVSKAQIVSKKMQLISPEDRGLIQKETIVFSWLPLKKRSLLYVLNVDTDLSMEENIKKNDIALREIVINDNSFKTAALPKNKNYLWTVKSMKGANAADWRTFFYTDLDVDDSYGDCEQSLVSDSEFSGSGGMWSTTGANQVRSTSMGCDNLGFAMLSSASPGVLKQTLSAPTVIGENYALNFCFVNGVRNQTADTELTVVAYKGSPSSFEPGPDVALIYKSGNLVNSKNWLEFEAPVWTANDAFDQIAFFVSSKSTEKVTVKLGIDNVCLAETTKDPCDFEYEMQLDQKGGYTILDKKLDRLLTSYSPKVTETKHDFNRGPVTGLYGYMSSTETDTFYKELDLSSPCFSIGGYDPTQEFKKIDNKIDTVLQTKILKGITELAPRILKKPFLPDGFPTIPDVGANSPGCDYGTADPSLPFGGADIVYVHGLALGHIEETLSPNQIHKKYQASWPQDKNDFLRGEYKKYADEYWSEHIETQIEDSRGRLSNRYMTVAWPSDQRLGDGIHAVLDQISNAIRTGEGVKYNKNDPRKDSCFGERIVFVTHSTGGLLTSSLLGIGELSKTNLDIQKAYGQNLHHITDRVVGQVALSGAFSGSKLASAAVVAPQLLGAVIGASSTFAGVAVQAAVSKYAKVVNNSVLIDLIPPVSQKYWAKEYFHLATKPTLTVAGSTPGLPQSGAMGWAGKFLIRGYNDGVLSMDCQCGSDQKWWLRSSFLVNNPLQMWDWGNPITTKAMGLAWDSRYRRLIGFSPLRNSACIPYLTPAGMLTPFYKNVTGIKRWDNHYSLIQSTMTHFDPTAKMKTYYPNNSPSVIGFIDNNEESRVVTSTVIYNQGYVENSFKNIVDEHVRKKTIGFHLPAIKRSRRFPYFKIYWKYYEIVIWKRTYHFLRNHVNKNSSDYVYEYVFRR